MSEPQYKPRCLNHKKTNNPHRAQTHLSLFNLTKNANPSQIGNFRNYYNPHLRGVGLKIVGRGKGREKGIIDSVLLPSFFCMQEGSSRHNTSLQLVFAYHLLSLLRHCLSSAQSKDNYIYTICYYIAISFFFACVICAFR